METSETGPASAAQSATRWSMPSYRPHAKTRPGSVAHSAATACVKGRPAGVGTTSRVPGGRTASSASAHGSGVIHGAVHVVGPLPQVVHADHDEAAFGGLA